MIVGAILEMSYNASGVDTGGMNGAAMIQFTTQRDAEQWAILQSELVTYGTNGTPLYTLTTVINTDTGVKRWWYNGIEYTG